MPWVYLVCLKISKLLLWLKLIETSIVNYYALIGTG